MIELYVLCLDNSQRLMVVSLASLYSWAGSGCSLITPHTEALNYDGMKVKKKKRTK